MSVTPVEIRPRDSRAEMQMPQKLHEPSAMTEKVAELEIQVDEMEVTIAGLRDELAHTRDQLAAKERENQRLERLLATERKTLDHFMPLIEGYKKQAVTDDLTGILNYKGLVEWGEQVYDERVYENEQYRACIVVFDIAGFSYVNNYLGHDKGNELLSLLPNIFESTVRTTEAEEENNSDAETQERRNHTSEDYVFGRLGGDEFMLILDIGNYQINSEEDEFAIHTFVSEAIISRVVEEFNLLAAEYRSQILEKMKAEGKEQEFEEKNPLRLHRQLIMNEAGEYFERFFQRAMSKINRQMKQKTD